MYELLSNHIVAGIVGAAFFLVALFAFAGVWNAADRRLAKPAMFRSTPPSDDELILAIKDIVSRSRRRLFRPHVQGSNRQRPRPIADRADLETAEARMGVSLPVLLRRLYLEVANGGFGPPYGLLGIGDGACDSDAADISREYVGRREGDPDDPAWQWPENVVPLIELGCGSYLCVDVASPDTPIVEFNADVLDSGRPMREAFKLFYPTLRVFLQDWVTGKAVIPGWGVRASGA